MKRIITFLLILVALALPGFAVSGQAAPGVSVLDRAGQVQSRITDGDGIQLRAVLPAKAAESTLVEFFVTGFDPAVAACTVKSGEDTCLSDLFPALGWYWLPEQRVSAQVNGQPLPGEAILDVAPRPVVMVHGFISSWETWQNYLAPDGYLAVVGLQGFAVGDGQFPGVLNTGSPNNPEGRTNSIAQNAAILGEYIAAVQKKTGAEQVDLLVHSMGGMITRFYLDRVMQDDNVAQVIFLGTPHSGSACVYPVAALGYLLPASIEIQPAYMEGVFNQQIVHRRGVPFHMVAGTRLLEPVASPCTNVPSDTVVGIDSAASIPLDSLERIPLIHGDLTVNRAVFEQAVLPLLQADPAAFAPRPDPSNSASETELEQFSRTFTGHVNPGESQEITIPIDPDVTLANFSLFDSTRSVQLEVRGASGNVVSLDPQKNGILEVNDPETMIFLGYGFAQPKPGAWVVKVSASAETPATGADFALNARYLGGATLSAGTNPTIPAFGSPVEISASLSAAGQAVQVTSAQALLRQPDGSQETLQLTQNGEQFTASYEPAASGLYAVEVLVTGQTEQGLVIDRAAYLSFEVQPAAEEVTGVRTTLFAGVGLIGVVAGLACLGVVALVGVIIVVRVIRKR